MDKVDEKLECGKERTNWRMKKVCEECHFLI
jgi:hypothetical protein